MPQFTNWLLPRVLLAIIVACALSGCSDDKTPLKKFPPVSIPPDYEPESPRVTDCYEAGGDCRTLLDCSVSSSACTERSVAFDFEGCMAAEERDKCENFAKRFRSVTLISDSGNYISAPFTQMNYQVELLDDSLKAPWDLEILPDASMLISQRGGTVVHRLASGESRTVLELEVIDTGEAGLMGLAVDPDFADNGFVYLIYSYKLDDSDPSFINPKDATTQRLLNKLSRWRLDGDALVDEFVLLDRLPGSILHTGSRLEFGPDGKLYATTGDAHNAGLTQDIDFLGGKILRLNPDGSIPADNPVKGSYVYALAHRNLQGLAWHPETGQLYTSEHGPQRFDEINRVAPGQNSGWGVFKCDERMSRREASGPTEPPLVCFKVWTMGPSGMQFVADPQSPWYGSLFVAALRGKHLHRYVFEGEDAVVDEIFWVNTPQHQGGTVKRAQIDQRLRDVEYHDGSLYVIGDSHILARITPLGARENRGSE
tara:strand:- start:226 stop:1674 length:1449 start_codon:yes stop_codon:yes gene_type:complete